MSCDYVGETVGLPWLQHLGECAEHRQLAWEDHSVPRIYVGTVPGGYNDSGANRFHRSFDEGMYEYEKARKEGLQPKATTVDAVRAEQNRVKSHERALKKLSKVADVSELSAAPGVKG